MGTNSVFQTQPFVLSVTGEMLAVCPGFSQSVLGVSSPRALELLRIVHGVRVLPE